MRNLIVLVALAALAAAPAADNPVQPPRLPAARDALDKFAADKIKAKNAYDDAISAASADAVAALGKAKADVMKAGNLDEANRIEAAIAEIKSAPVIKKPVAIGDYLFSSRLSKNSHITLRLDGTIISDGHDWSLTWRLKYDGCLELRDKNALITLVKTPTGWAGSNVDNAPVSMVQR